MASNDDVTNMVQEFVQMMVSEFFVPFDEKFNDEEVPIGKEQLLQYGHHLYKELAVSLEHQVKLFPQQRPRVPLFFIKGHNFLREKFASINMDSTIIDFLPIALETSMLDEMGPGIFPELRDGLFYDIASDGTIGTEIDLFVKDIVSYCHNAFLVTGVLPRLPHSYIISVSNFRKMYEADPTRQNYARVFLIPRFVEKALKQVFEEKDIPVDYVEREGNIENHQF